MTFKKRQRVKKESLSWQLEGNQKLWDTKIGIKCYCKLLVAFGKNLSVYTCCHLKVLRGMGNYERTHQKTPHQEERSNGNTENGGLIGGVQVLCQ